MSKTKEQKPEVINLSEGRLDQIKSQLLATSLPEDDKKIVVTILTTYVWLTRQLRSTKLTITRLKRLFGFTTEKHANKDKSQNNLPPDNLTALSNNASGEEQAKGEQETPEKKSLYGTQNKITGV